MYYYKIDDVNIGASFLSDVDLERTEAPASADNLFWLFRRPADSCRTSFLVNSADLLYQADENVSWLSSNELKANKTSDEKPDDIVLQAIEAGTLKAVNVSDDKWREAVDEKLLSMKKKRVHILAIGDVGSNLLTGLHLLGGDCIASIGICDIDEKVTARWQFEQNQIAYPWDYNALPEVDVVKPEDLFKCDVFVFVASKGIPAVGSGIKDVRMYQFENNSKIISIYAKQARRENFKGLFACVSDPVDPLAKTAWLVSNQDEDGNFDGKGLRAEQVQGFGLGVMNARAAYYAKRDERFKQFLTEGRSFGPHGQELVVADSIENYNDELSRELTEKAVTANLEMRAIGFKPFVAPAFSSGAISLILLMRGEWHCGSVFMGGIFMGVKNRYTPNGLETEILPLPEKLMERIRFAEETLHKII